MRAAAAVAAIVIGFAALAAMRTTTPHYIDITGPIGVDGKADQAVRLDNLIVTAGQPILAKQIRFRTTGKVETRDSAGVWLVVPLTSEVRHTTASILGRVWQTPDGRAYSASQRVEDAAVALTATKTLQPGLVRHDLVVFEIHPDVAQGGTLLLSEQKYPQLRAQARIAYPNKAFAPAVPLLDLDDLHAKL